MQGMMGARIERRTTLQPLLQAASNEPHTGYEEKSRWLKTP